MIERKIGIPWLCRYERCGTISFLQLLGFDVYIRVDRFYWLFGYMFEKEG